MLLEEVLAQARRHEHPTRLRVGTEVSLAALTPGRRNIRVELHYSSQKKQGGVLRGGGVGGQQGGEWRGGGRLKELLISTYTQDNM